MFTLVVVAMIVLYGIGCYLLGDKEAMRKQLRKVMWRRKSRRELSLIRAVVELVAKDRSYMDVLDHRVKLNLKSVL